MYTSNTAFTVSLLARMVEMINEIHPREMGRFFAT